MPLREASPLKKAPDAFVPFVIDAIGIHEAESCANGARRAQLGSLRGHHPTSSTSIVSTGSRRVQAPCKSPAKEQSTRWDTPSNFLIDALQRLGHHHAVPEPQPFKSDLSFSRQSRPGSRSKRLKSEPVRELNSIRKSPYDDDCDLSLPAILARYLNNLSSIPTFQLSSEVEDTHTDLSILDTFTEGTLSRLEKKGFDVDDVVTWAWIITARDGETASLRLWQAQYRSQAKGRSTQLPTFVLLFLLRRPNINPKALRNILVYAWSCVRRKWPSLNANGTPSKIDKEPDQEPKLHHGKEISTEYLGTGPSLDESSLLILFVRLLRHARRVWPESIVSISELLSFMGQDALERGDVNKRRSRLTVLFNRALSLLSLPSSKNPFESTPFHQRAQFNLIKRMSAFSPPIAITQEGYRAVVKVQLAHKKTSNERHWASSKAKSWPPWKEAKMAIDLEEKPRDGWTRATEAMLRMKEAGYVPSRWEKIADLLAGWDTDGSPTIQTRSIIRRSTSPGTNQPCPPSRDDPDIPLAYDSIEDRNDIWAARIEATRTVQEAWACFLAHEDRHLKRSPEIYFAMFQKLVFEEKRHARARVDESASMDLEIKDSPHPGDGKEVRSAPISPQEAVYVRSQPPMTSELFDKMIRESIRPSKRCLAFLVSHANSIKAGTKYLRESGIVQPTLLSALISSQRASLDLDESTKDALQLVPIQIFAAFVQLLCRFSSYSVNKQATSREHELPPGGTFDLQVTPTFDSIQTSRPLLHALKLLHFRKPSYRPAWNSVLLALARSNSLSDGLTLNLHIQNWCIMKDLVDQMEHAGLDLDVSSFQTLCLGLEKATLVSLYAMGHQAGIIAGTTDVSTTPNVPNGCVGELPQTEARAVLSNGPDYIKSKFENLVDSAVLLPGRRANGPEDATPKAVDNPFGSLPLLITTPGPSQLHAYIRVLGFLRDFEGIIGLVKWMVRFRSDLDAKAQEAKNGRRLTRRSMIALRVFLERSWENPDITDHGSETDEDRQSARAENHSGANGDTVSVAKRLVQSQESWGGWATDEEVQDYCTRGRFSFQDR
ncbi:MAG: hypothetical protein M4579_002042 [Chaenotheca gracillima]|nr:MAG: hypothetical protein M4579_002042 [Chaenotheca gracillima]